MSEIAIKLRNISKHYKLYASPSDRIKEIFHPFNKIYHRKHHVLGGVDLSLQKGEILGIVGKNGSGKSTLLKIIAGILQPNDGTVEVSGSIAALLELGGGLNSEFTGVQNIQFAVTLKGFTGNQFRSRVKKIGEFADIGEYLNQPVKTYSSGMKSRLSFAIAVNVDTDILILDEVLAVGDEAFRRKCYSKMEEYFTSGKTIIYVSHNANSVMELCSRALFLDSTKILLESDPKTVVTYYQKHLYAKPEDRPTVLDEIHQIRRSQYHEKEFNADFIPSRGKLVVEKQDLYHHKYNSGTLVEYRNFDVDIKDVCIKSTRNNKTNILHFNQRYNFCVKVSFQIDVDNVGFSFSIKNEKGFDICSYRTLKKDYICCAKRDIYDVRWSFMNRLMPGMYYLNVGVRAYPENKESYILNRIIDVEAFKVESSGFKNFGGIVSLEQEMIIKNVTSEKMNHAAG